VAKTAPKTSRLQSDRRALHANALIAHVDALAERLRPEKRRADRGAPPCSAQELFALNTLGRRGRLTMTDLAGAMGVPLSTASRIVDRLADKDLVIRAPQPHDRRVVHVAFSRRGERINRYVAESRLAIARELLGVLGDRRAASLIAALGQLAPRSG
jgi:DNA-binding MarR family transcriptional regulator